MEQDKLEKPTSYENLEEMNIKGWLSLVSVSYTHLTLPTNPGMCRSRWSPYH